MALHSIKTLFLPHPHNNHRPNFLQVEGIAALCLIMLVGQVVLSVVSKNTIGFSAVLGFTSTITATDVVAQTNDRRHELGLGTLTLNNTLSEAALAKGNNMCAENYWAHVSPKGETPWLFMRQAGYSYAVAGENLARDFADTPSMVDAWMASPTHRANLLSDRFQEIGVAVIYCNLIGNDTALVVQMFGTQVTPVARKPEIGSGTTLAQSSENVTAPVNPTTSADSPVQGEESTPVLISGVNPAVSFYDSESNLKNPAFSQLEITKAIILAIIASLCIVLCVDMWIAQDRHVVRLVGKNLAHLLFFVGIGVVVIVVKSGVIFAYGH